jgi:hypothetical protein
MIGVGNKELGNRKGGGSAEIPKRGNIFYLKACNQGLFTK